MHPHAIHAWNKRFISLGVKQNGQKHQEYTERAEAEWAQTPTRVDTNTESGHKQYKQSGHKQIWFGRDRWQKDRRQEHTEWQKGIEWAERHSWTKMQFTQTTKLDTKTTTDVYKVEGTKREWVQSDSQRERKSRINKVIEWAQTPTRVDSSTLKVGTNNTNRNSRNLP